METKGGGARSLTADDGSVMGMGPDSFFDGRTFDPSDMVKYLAASAVHALRVSLDELSARNA